MAETENLQVGWLKTRDNSKFVPYTLTENIYNQDGTLLKSDLNKIINRVDGIEQIGIPTVQEDISNLEGRTTQLEVRTQYLDASENDTFYITDTSGNIIAQVDQAGVKSINFTTYDGTNKIVDLNSLADTVAGLENTTIIDVYDAIENISTRTTQLETRTQYLDASEDNNIFYITDDKGNIIMQVDSTGIKSINFTSYNGTKKIIDLNSLNTQVSENLDNIDAIINTQLPDLSERTMILETRTQYMDASESADIFYITDDAGNIIMQVDNAGVKSINFTTYDGTKKIIDLNSLNTQVNTNVEDIAGIIDTTIPELSTRTTNLEVRTQYMDASEGSSIFYIIDESGNIIMQVDSEGIKSINFISYDGTKKIIDLNSLNSQVGINTTNIASIISKEIPNAKLELTKLINDNGALIETNKKNITANTADIKTFKESTIPGLDQRITKNTNDIAGIIDTGIPGVEEELTKLINANTALINTINTTTVPNLQKEIDANESAIGQTNKNVSDLTSRVSTNESDIEGIIDISIPKLQERTANLEIRTQYLDASEGSNAFYISDNENNIIMRVDETGTNSINFTSYNGTTKIADLNSVNTKANQNAVNIQGIISTDIPKAKDELNKLITANTDAIKVINDTTIPGLEEDIKDNADAINTINTTTVPGLEEDIEKNLKEINGLRDTTIPSLKTELNRLITTNINAINTINNTTIPNLQNKIQTNLNDINTINTTTIPNLQNEVNGIIDTSLPELNRRTTDLEVRTEYIDASSGSAILYITDISGNIIAQIDSDGIKSINFISYDGEVKTENVVANLNSVNTKANQNANNIQGIISTTIPNLKTELINQINTLLIHQVDSVLENITLEE